MDASEADMVNQLKQYEKQHQDYLEHSNAQIDMFKVQINQIIQQHQASKLATPVNLPGTLSASLFFLFACLLINSKAIWNRILIFFPKRHYKRVVAICLFRG